VVIQMMRLSDRSRKLVSLQEVTRIEGDVITMQEIFTFRRSGVAPDGKVKGHFSATGICPQFDQRLKEFGVPVSETLYKPADADA